MTKEALIFEVTDASYGKYVLLNSHKVPVLMAFIGVWSEHCIALIEMFEMLAREFPEQFVFAKLDIDENPDAKEKYEIKNVPTLAVFKDGEPVRREEGVLTEDEARTLLKEYGVYRESDEMRTQARELHMQGQTPQAITKLAEAMKSDPSNTCIALDMVQIFIDIGEYAEASALLERLPASDRESALGKSLSGQLWIKQQAAKTEGVKKLASRIADNEADYNAHFDIAVCEIARNNYTDAMSHLFFIQQHEPDFRDGAAREMIVSVINTLATNNPELAQKYRQQLSSMLNA